MNDSLFAGLCAALDTIVLVRDSGGRYLLMNHAPYWCKDFGIDTNEIGTEVQIKNKDEFIDNFLIDAAIHWSKMESGRLESGPWIIKDESGKEWPFELVAIYYQGASILAWQHLGETYIQQVGMLQKVRDRLLEQEVLELEVRKRTQQIRLREEEIAMRLLAAAGCRNEETGAHLKRIGLYTAAMGRALGWNQQGIDDIRIAAPMHDIGKIGIPDNIILKPGKLTIAEFEIMKRHTEIGAQLLSNTGIPLMEVAKNVAESHHEKWDGSGYPNKLVGENIPISARIVTIVDVYDALVHKRVYKSAMSEERTIEYMTAQVSIHFDPDLFGIFMDILPEMRDIRMRVTEDEYQEDLLEAIR